MPASVTSYRSSTFQIPRSSSSEQPAIPSISKTHAVVAAIIAGIIVCAIGLGIGYAINDSIGWKIGAGAGAFVGLVGGAIGSVKYQQRKINTEKQRRMDELFEGDNSSSYKPPVSTDSEDY